MTGDTALHLRRKVMLYTICAVLFSNCLIAFIAVFPLRSELRERQHQWMASLLEARTSAVNQYLDKFSEVARQIASRSMIRDKLEQYNQGKLSLDELREYARPKLRDALAQVDEAAGMARRDAGNASVVALGAPINPAFYPSHPPKRDDVWVSSPKSLGGEPVIVMAAGIYDAQGGYVGMDVVAYRLGGVLGLLDDHTELGATGGVQLCFLDATGSGKIRNADLGLGPTPSLCGALEMGGAFAGDILTSPLVAADSEGGNKAILFKRLPFENYFVMAFIGQDELYAPANRSLLLLVGLIALASLVSLAGAYRLLRPLTHRFLLREGELASIIADKTRLLQEELAAKEELGEALHKEKVRAEIANRSKSEFLANMSHEVRTPINGVMGMLQLLESTPLSEEQAEFVGLALQSSERLLRLLSDILDLSKIEAEKMEIIQKPFELKAALDDLVHLFDRAAREKGLSLRVDIDPDIPRRLLGDVSRLQQVLSNLVGNAIKFTSEGHVGVDVCLLPPTAPQLCRLLFSVTDSGIGIGDDVLPSLFSPFIQADGSYNRKFQGVGLGLAISKRIMGLMGGAMSVESEEGAGSTFYFSISFKPAEDAIPALPAPEEDAPGKGLHALLVEDDPTSSMVIRKMLDKLGLRSQAVEDGRAALEKLRSEAFDLALMDIQMPVMDGEEATKRIRAGEAGPDKAGLPIIALTAYAMDGDRQRFLQAGMTGVLTKPVKMQSLQDAIKEVEESLRESRAGETNE